MIQLRVLTEKGINEFSQYIFNLNNPIILNLPDLNHEPYSSVFNSEQPIEIDENLKFLTRMDIGKYLKKIFEKNGKKRSEIIGNNNLWTWLSYIWFKQLCKKKGNGIYKIYEIPKYICSSSWNRYYRHFIALPYYLVSLHGEKYTRLFLNSPPYEHGEAAEQLISSQIIMGSKPIIKAIHKLYWNEASNKSKSGALGKNKTDPGSARRLRMIINQLRLTYDLNSMNENDILKLLPSEFSGFIK